MSALDGELPSDLNECDAWLITGSRHDAYSDIPWILALRDWIRRAHDANVKLAGICFGHQVIAQALGGEVVKSTKGWGLGVSVHPMQEAKPWMQPGLETIRDLALNERDYGELSGLNKDDARKKWGEEQVHVWRRSYDIPPPGGESLKDTAARVLPFYKSRIWPELKAGRNVIVAAHGNSIRALIMYLEELSAKQILEREVATGVPIIYRLTETGQVAERREVVA